MKTKHIIIIILIVISIASIMPRTFAEDIKQNPVVYNFLISSNEISEPIETNILLPYTVDQKTLINGKIAPGTHGSFEINVNIAENIQASYILSFSNFSANLPQNLKFYYLNKEIDIKTFSISENDISNGNSYIFMWKWDYETENGDVIDTNDSLITNLNFDINLSANYETKDNKSENEVLPRTGDIETNF